jgi:hypothetical protein
VWWMEKHDYSFRRELVGQTNKVIVQIGDRDGG